MQSRVSNQAFYRWRIQKENPVAAVKHQANNDFEQLLFLPPPRYLHLAWMKIIIKRKGHSWS